MAAPITHIVLADKIYKKYFSNRNKEKFFVGTSFPDIRYLGTVPRSKTHHTRVSFASIQQSTDSFNAGSLLHSFVDEAREKYMKENRYYLLFPRSKFTPTASKMYEDMVLYGKIKNWPEIVSYFDKIYKEELIDGIKKEDVEKWHQKLKDYFSYKPTGQDLTTSANKMSSFYKEGEKIAKTLIASDMKSAKRIILELYENFEKLLS